MGTNQSRSKGFTLIASLLLLLLLSGVAVGLMYMTNTEVRVGGNDLENNLAFYGAEAGMEKMTSDLGNLYNGNQAPSVGQIQALSGFPPVNVPGMTYTEYNFSVPVDPITGLPVTNIANIKSGANQGLVAEIIPMTLSVSATRLSGAQVRMQRSVEVALIPVFQFGVFSQSDLSYFPGPTFDFAGRVHTNGNLFMAESDSNGLVFHSKLTAAGEVIRDKLANGVDVVGDGRTGPVYAPNTAGGCDAGHPAVHCINLAPNQGSYLGGPPPVGTSNPAWVGISTNTYKGWILNGLTGAVALNLPFVSPGVGPIEIVRKPPAGELAGSSLSVSRLYNKAQIRVLMSDDLPNLHPERGAGQLDADDVQLNEEAGAFYTNVGVPVTGMPGGGNSHFAYASNKNTNGIYFDPPADQVTPPKYAGRTQWPLVDGWLRVEYKNAAGNWTGVTRQWLQLGFGRSLAPGASAAVHPNAILIFQMLADRTDPTPDGKFLGANESAVPNISRYNWYPINMYDPREGEVRDTDPGRTGAAATCAPNGVMNVIEIDVGNLRRWLTGAVAGSGTLVDSQTLNGYLLYFSDRRGMVANPNTVPVPILTGEYGWEDTINKASAAGTPDGQLEPVNAGTTQSPEDVDQNSKLDNWGVARLGDAFGVNTNTVPPNAYAPRVNCLTLARKNQVTAARHVLRLVDGKLGNLPTRPDGTGGFTVASENPVYILGDYNANGGFGAGNAAAAVIVDSLSLLSNNYTDVNSLWYPTTIGNRPATQTWYRVAIAAGKNVNFPLPTAWTSSSDYGTDGGVHNFLRYLENWSGTNLNYDGSLVSLFYSQYGTGIFKCCATVYGAPVRAYAFDTLFLNPNNLPPGTPEFEDVNNVSYRQDFKPY